ncbi:MAG TPA: GlsB/YeaQ/YmgE family stress response membrane protein [Acidimicrobiales bacterium]
MGILGWIVVGLIAGALARWVTGSTYGGCGCIGTIVIGVVGAFIGGALYRFAMGDEVDTFDRFDLESVVVAFLGAVVLLLVLEALGRGSRRRPWR